MKIEAKILKHPKPNKKDKIDYERFEEIKEEVNTIIKNIVNEGFSIVEGDGIVLINKKKEYLKLRVFEKCFFINKVIIFVQFTYSKEYEFNILN